MLAMHQDVQQKLFNEIDSICGAEKDLTFDNDFLQKFTYLDLIVKETIRLFPAGPIVARETSEEIEICGYKIPKKTIMVMSIFAMQRDQKYWGDDAHLYRPERFENLENPQAYLPFTGEGLCTFTFFGISLIIFKIIYLFSFVVVPKIFRWKADVHW